MQQCCWKESRSDVGWTTSPADLGDICLMLAVGPGWWNAEHRRILDEVSGRETECQTQPEQPRFWIGPAGALSFRCAFGL